MKRVLIQTDDHGQPYSQAGAAAARGFEDLGYEVQFFKRSALAGLVLASGTVLVGGTGTTRSALEQIGAALPAPLNLPRELQPYWGRQIWQTTLGEVVEAGAFPVFVKPADSAKAFHGQVLQQETSRLFTVRAKASRCSPLLLRLRPTRWCILSASGGSSSFVARFKESATMPVTR